MIQRALIGTVLAGLALGVTGQAQQIRVQRPPAAAPTRAQSRAVFLEACGRCHPPERVTATRRTKAQWEESINAMVTSRGATLTADQHDIVLQYVATGNPQPVIAHANRAGDNLFTGSVVALDADTGKMAWYFQSSPHDTHDWDSTQTPVLFDAELNGQPRKLLAQAARNGHFFVLDRTNGKALVSAEFVKTNWSKGYDAKGQPIPDPAKMPQVDGALVSPNQGGATNWPPPSFSPATGLFYVSAARAFSVYYIYDTSDNPQCWGGTDRGGYSESMVRAIDYRDGKIRWSHKWEGNGLSGLLSTAGNLLFSGDGSSTNFVALRATTGEPLWHANLGSPVSNGPITYELDGTQYVIVGAGDTLWAFAMLTPTPASPTSAASAP